MDVESMIFEIPKWTTCSIPKLILVLHALCGDIEWILASFNMCHGKRPVDNNVDITLAIRE